MDAAQPESRIESPDPSASPIQPQRRRRQLRACNACHRRKVRCDAVERQTCSNCRATGDTCRFDVVEALSRKHQDRRQATAAAATSTTSKASASTSTPLATTNPAQPDPDSSRALEPGPMDQGNDPSVDHGLVDLFRHGIHSQSWALFDHVSYARMCYIGTSLSNLSHLVSGERLVDKKGLHYPIPQIRRVVSWKPGVNLPELQSRNNITQDLTSFPIQDVGDALVDAFFNDINPIFPVVDESEFRTSYNDNQSPPPLLLLQAVLLAGAHACQHAKVVGSRASVKAVLFQRAKTLWDLRFENDRVTLVQAALIFSWHCESADNVSANSYYWISVAAGIAYGLGMHRNPSQSSYTVMPQNTKNLFRRLWWTLFQAAVATALEHGRPLLTQPHECDHQLLTEADLVESDGRVNTRIYLQYCVQNTALCLIIADILNMHSPGSLQTNGLSETTAIDGRLAAWFMALPSGNDPYMLQLRLHYNTALVHLHRAGIQMGSLPDPTYSSKICATAVDAIVNIFGSIVRTRTMQRCYITALTAIMAAAIHMTRDLHLAIEQHSTLLALQLQSQLEDLFPLMSDLAPYWPTANAILNLFQHILERSKTTMASQSNTALTNLNPTLDAVDDYPPLDWDLIFSTLHPDISEHSGLDCSNVASWITN